VPRKKPLWAEPVLAWISFGVPLELSELASEIYEAVWAGQYRLAAMGTRALLEQAKILKVGDHGSFSTNLDAYCERGFISVVQRDAMNAILDAGHASMHRMYKPTDSDLQAVLDIAEGIFESVYIHGAAAKKLSERVPVRQRKGKVIPLRGPDDHGMRVPSITGLPPMILGLISMRSCAMTFSSIGRTRL
jgi:hypothetical protein